MYTYIYSMYCCMLCYSSAIQDCIYSIHSTAQRMRLGCRPPYSKNRSKCTAMQHLVPPNRLLEVWKQISQ